MGLLDYNSHSPDDNLSGNNEFLDRLDDLPSNNDYFGSSLDDLLISVKDDDIINNNNVKNNDDVNDTKNTYQSMYYLYSNEKNWGAGWLCCMNK